MLFDTGVFLTLSCFCEQSPDANTTVVTADRCFLGETIDLFV